MMPSHPPWNAWTLEVTDTAAIVQEYRQGEPETKHVFPLGEIGKRASAEQVQAVLKQAEELCDRLNAEMNQTNLSIMTRVVIKKRSDDFHASIVGRVEWGCGKTPSAALGDLVSAHPALFGIEVSHEEDKNKSDVRRG